MTGWLDSNWLRVAGYGTAALAAFWAGWREMRQRRSNPYLWPTFWFLTGTLLLLMALGRTGDVGDWIAQIGRRVARSHGWYADRRRPQAIAVGSIGALWFVVVVIALWRIPERRRRYLPAALSVFTLICYAGIRVISLHQVDALLYHRQLASTRIDAVAELTLLLITIAVTLWPPALRAVRPEQAERDLLDDGTALEHERVRR